MHIAHVCTHNQTYVYGGIAIKKIPKYFLNTCTHNSYNKTIEHCSVIVVIGVAVVYREV